jgi:hypothetical protein
VQFFSLLGRSQRAVAEARACAALGRWLDAWQASRSTAVSVQSVLPEDWIRNHAGANSAGWRLHRLEDEYWVALLIPAEAGRALAAVFSGEDLSRKPVTASASPLVVSLIDSALAELAVDVLIDASNGRTERGVRAEKRVELPREIWKRGSGGLVFAMAFSGVQLWLVASVGIVRALLGGKRPSARGMLTGRGDSLAQQDVTLFALAGEADVRLEDLQTMSVGDVVRLNSAVTDRFKLALAEGVTLGHGLLGCYQKHKAIQLTP